MRHFSNGLRTASPLCLYLGMNNVAKIILGHENHWCSAGILLESHFSFILPTSSWLITEVRLITGKLCFDVCRDPEEWVILSSCLVFIVVDQTTIYLIFIEIVLPRFNWHLKLCIFNCLNLCRLTVLFITSAVFSNDHKMALLQCRSKEDAIIALIVSNFDCHE